MTLIDVIISHGADLATTTRAAVETANRTGKITGVRWGQIRWDVWPGDTVERGVQRFHAKARQVREEQARDRADTEEEA